jgi:hypothetical protein
MLALYWDLAEAIEEKLRQAAWGEKVITQLADDLSREFKDITLFWG